MRDLRLLQQPKRGQIATEAVRSRSRKIRQLLSDARPPPITLARDLEDLLIQKAVLVGVQPACLI